MMDVWNIVVVVSRWFGGTHIGPDRFKHINSAARESVLQKRPPECAVASTNEKKGSKSKKKN